MALSPVISIVDRSRSQFKSLINEIFDGGGHGRRKYIILIDCVVGEWRWETLKDTVTI